MIYLLDTNVIADRMRAVESVSQRLTQAIRNGQSVYLCQPVIFETRRGLLKVNATRKLSDFETKIVPLLETTPLLKKDWEQAAQFWADARNAGRQLSDIDLLLAASSVRLDATLVSADADFDILPVRRENWRTT